MPRTDSRTSTVSSAPDAREQDPIRIVLASDDPFSREAFRAATNVPDVQLVASTTVAEAAENTAPEARADVIVLDAQLPALRALEALARIRTTRPESRVLVFSTPESEEFGLLCLSIGASGYLSKEIDLASMPRILRRMRDGEVVFSRRLGTSLVGRLRQSGHRRGAANARVISAPERKMLELIGAGHGVDEAAAHLGVNASTVRRHLASARRKLAAQSVGGATS